MVGADGGNRMQELLYAAGLAHCTLYRVRELLERGSADGAKRVVRLAIAKIEPLVFGEERPKGIG